MFTKLTPEESRAFIRGGMTEGALERVISARAARRPPPDPTPAPQASKPEAPVKDGMVLDLRVGWNHATLITSLQGWPTPSGYRSKTEAAWAAQAGLLGASAVAYEALTLRFGQLRYTPDFVLVFDDRIELVEVKGGYQWAKDRVRFKAAAFAFPMFALTVWALQKGKWNKEVISDGRR